MIRRFILIAVPVSVVLGMFGIVYHFDVATERLELRIYCHNVRYGQWPDYEGIYEKECCPPPTKIKAAFIAESS